MRKGVFAACLLVSSGALCGGAEAQTCAAPEFLNTMVMEPVAGSDLMTVPLTVNGKPKKFLLSTSEPFTLVSQAMVRDLGLPETSYMAGARELNVRGSHSADDARIRVRIAELGLGTQKGSGFQFLVSDDRELGNAKPYDGILSNDLFSNVDLDMDFGAKRLNYFGLNHCPGNVVYWSQRPVAVIPITLAGSKINVPVIIDGQKINAVIDTGAARTSMRRDIADLTFDLKPDTPQMMPAGDLRDGHGAVVYSHRFQRLSLEGVDVKDPAILIQTNAMVRNRDSGLALGSRAQSTEPRPPDLTIGMDLLHQLHVYVASGEKKLYVTAAGTGETEVFRGVVAPPIR
jgi:hypothetical protein